MATITNASRKELNCECRWCGEKFHISRGRIARGDGKYCSRSCYWSARACGIAHPGGSRHHNWRGGTCPSGGYIKIRTNIGNGKYAYQMEHRFVMEKHLRRKLRQDEIVHHIDGDRHNNDISNLELTTRGEHKMGYWHGYKSGYVDSALEILAHAVSVGV